MYALSKTLNLAGMIISFIALFTPQPLWVGLTGLGFVLAAWLLMGICWKRGEFDY